MNRLTQEDAERCARACGWEYRRAGDREEAYWISPEGLDYDCLSSPWSPKRSYLEKDPFFWFPRLWERLKARLGVMGAAELRYCPKYRTGVSIDVFNAPYKPGTVEWGKTFTGDECISLCAAIEALEEKK